MMRLHLDLFSGIGGFALACRQNGIETAQFVEIDERCRDFLSKAWPGVPIHDDVRTFHHSGGPVFLLTGGVPCQPASRAGKQRGAEDDRWLWPEALRILAEVKPSWAVFENPPGIGDVGLSGILSDVEGHGYEVRVFGVPACAVGSPQIRMRYWIVAHSAEPGYKIRGVQPRISGSAEPGNERETADVGAESLLANPGLSGRWASERPEQCETARPRADIEIGMADPSRNGERRIREAPGTDRERAGAGVQYGDMADAGGGDCSMRRTIGHGEEENGRSWAINEGLSAWGQFVWLPCADGKIRRAPDDSFGLVDGLHRSVLAALGNSIVPQVATEIIRAIVEASEC